MDASKIFMFNEGEPGSLVLENFNQDPENVKAAFAMDDLARLVDTRQMGDGRQGQEAFQRAGGPTGT